MTRKVLFRSFVILAGILLLQSGFGIVATVDAGSYPERRIEVIIPWGIGTTTDLCPRIIAPYLEKILGQSIVVISKTGGAGVKAHHYVARAKPDGYTAISLASMYGGMWVTRDMPFDWLDLELIIGYAQMDIFWHFKKDARWKTFPEFIEEARKNPGKLTYSTYATLSGAHLLSETIFKKEGVKVIHIASRGSAAAMTALLGGHVDASCIYGSAGHSGGGQIKTLAVASEKRRPDKPDIPTVKELGYDLALPTAVALAVPKGTPQEIKDIIVNAVTKVMTDNKEAITKAFSKFEAIPIILNEKEIKAMAKEQKKWWEINVPPVMKEIGVRKKK